MLLTALIVLPALGALPMVFARDPNARELKAWAFVVALGIFFASLPLWGFNPSGDAYQWVESRSWIQTTGLTINYSLGVDGISSLLVLLTTFTTPLVILGAFKYIQKRQK